MEKEIFDLTGLIGIDYGAFDNVKRELNAAKNNFETDKDSLQNAKPDAHEALGDVETAINTVKNKIESIETFMQDLENYVTKIQNFDTSLASSFVVESTSDGEIEAILNLGDSFDLIDMSEVIEKARASGMSVNVKGNYVIIKGYSWNRKGLDLLEDVKGNHYRIGSDNYYNARLDLWTLPPNCDMDTFVSKYISNLPTTFKKSFEEFGTKTYGFSKDKGVWGNAATAMGYVDAALNVVDGVQDNIQKNETSGIQYVGDAIVDGADGLASMAAGSVGAQIGAALGTAIPIPIVGTVVGAVAGFAVGWIAGKAYDWVTDGWQIGGKTIKEHFKSGVEWFSDTAGNWWDSVTGWA